MKMTTKQEKTKQLKCVSKIAINLLEGCYNAIAKEREDNEKDIRTKQQQKKKWIPYDPLAYTQMCHEISNAAIYKQWQPEGGVWIGVCKSVDPCYFLARSVNPMLFSFKSGSALF